MATTNLYPPMVDTYMPAFLIEEGKSETKNICRVYFSLSLYNSDSDIANVQVTVTDQDTNISVLDTAKYPTGIMLTSLQTDLSKASNDIFVSTGTSTKTNDLFQNGDKVSFCVGVFFVFWLCGMWDIIVP